MLSKQKQVFVTLLLLLFLPLLLSAQWLETTIYIPDFLSGIQAPQAFVYNPANNTVYVGGARGDCVIAIDGATDEKIARIPAGENIKAMCWNSTNNKVYSAYNPTSNKVYCASFYGGAITVIDGATNEVIATTEFVGEPLVYNSTNNKIYCACGIPGYITVIDGVSQ
jgi:YVTN family beta-propeller protein